MSVRHRPARSPSSPRRRCVADDRRDRGPSSRRTRRSSPRRHARTPRCPVRCGSVCPRPRDWPPSSSVGSGPGSVSRCCDIRSGDRNRASSPAVPSLLPHHIVPLQPPAPPIPGHHNPVQATPSAPGCSLPVPPAGPLWCSPRRSRPRPAPRRHEQRKGPTRSARFSLRRVWPLGSVGRSSALATFAV